MTDDTLLARTTLGILERQEEWDADTPGDIASAAIDLGLADTNGPDGLFRDLTAQKSPTHTP